MDGDFDLTPIAKQVAAVTAGRVALDPETRRFSATALTKVDAGKLQLTVPAILSDNLNAFLDKFEAAPEAPQVAKAERFSVPLLAVRRGDQLEIFDQTHFLDTPWALESCNATALVDRFSEPVGDDREAVIDIGAAGKMGFGFVERLHAELALAVDERDWPYPKLVRWLDQRLSAVKGQDVTQGSAQSFIKAGLNALMETSGYSLADLRRHRFRLVDPFARLISEYRATRATDAFETTLFGDLVKFEASPDLSVVFDPDTYHPIEPADPRAAFPKHIRPDMIAKMNDEEEKCALAIELHPKVERWVRNIERLPTSFRLRVSNQWFYPDFVAQLNDGGIVVIEYKGKGTEGPADRTEEKEAIGKKWAAVSGNRFVMAKDRDYDAVARAIAG